MIHKAMILAAGLGTRMRPLTLTTPKPLVKVLGKTLFDYNLDAAIKAGISKFVVNVHYLADQIERHIDLMPKIDITISDERDLLLDSAGGIQKALHHFDGEPFMVLNSDTFWVGGENVNLRHLIDRWDSNKMDILIALAEREKAIGFSGAGDFFKNEAGHLTRRGTEPTAPFAFTGDYIIHPRIFSQIPEEIRNNPFSSNILFDRAIDKHSLYGLKLDGLWLDVGTPQSVALAETAISKLPIREQSG